MGLPGLYFGPNFAVLFEDILRFLQLRAMLKITKALLPALVLSLFLASCKSTPEGFAISGQVTQASNMQVMLDRLMGPNAAFESIGRADADGSGNFSINVPDGVEPGVYRLRFGARKLPLILDGSEGEVVIEGDLNGLERFEYQVEGSASSHSFQRFVQALANRQYTTSDAANYIDSAANPYAGIYLTEIVMGGNPQFMESYEKAQQRLESSYPGTTYGTNYASFLSQVKAAYAQQQAQELIKVGMPAPDIELPGVDGKKSQKLSDLKGQIVLLDFWASWCMPCRRENPHVVDVYNRYKDKGFTVYSVSLDGIDDRMRSSMQGSSELDQQIEAQRNRWVAAIEQDKLTWPYHVSDLKKWNTLPAATYGVSGIPKTFLIDREGNIAGIDLRYPALEPALQRLISEEG